jgi:hypothetical protein
MGKLAAEAAKKELGDVYYEGNYLTVTDPPEVDESMIIIDSDGEDDGITGGESKKRKSDGGGGDEHMAKRLKTSGEFARIKKEKTS